MGLIIIGAGVVAAAIIVALFLPQTASLFPDPGEIVDSVASDMSGIGEQAQGAVGGMVDNATRTVGGMVDNATRAATDGAAAIGVPTADGSSGGGGGGAGSAAPPDSKAPPASSPRPHAPSGTTGGEEAAATAKAAAAEASIGTLASLSSGGADGPKMPAMCIPR